MKVFEALTKYVKQEMWASHCSDCAFHTEEDGQRMCGTFNDALTQHNFISHVHEEKKKEQIIGDDYWTTLGVNDEEDNDAHVMVFSKTDKHATCTKHLIEIPFHLRSKTFLQRKYERIRQQVMEATIIEESESEDDSEVIVLRRKKKKKPAEPWYYHPALGNFKKSDFSPFE